MAENLETKFENITQGVMLGSIAISTIGGFVIDKYLLNGDGAAGTAMGAIASLPLSALCEFKIRRYFDKKYNLNTDNFEDRY